ncbi:hypothetical protein DAPPUDRAFT_110127 [Daphnia pulex]|uniref:Uncharacterized protein n=1 Tax=Daphnia pulex TaxID=6669 RepID=E9H5B0_DAPPU|nr:hypothetical protein DAPPUDRAFT_110127 [Daphnia pulex]|eukprot:EFX73110.1 hypothetical protein DAPPUDRAFT_110127 [Daphnia pulex]
MDPAIMGRTGLAFFSTDEMTLYLLYKIQTRIRQIRHVLQGEKLPTSEHYVLRHPCQQQNNSPLIEPKKSIHFYSLSQLIERDKQPFQNGQTKLLRSLVTEYLATNKTMVTRNRSKMKRLFPFYPEQLLDEKENQLQKQPVLVKNKCELELELEPHKRKLTLVAPSSGQK